MAPRPRSSVPSGAPPGDGVLFRAAAKWPSDGMGEMESVTRWQKQPATPFSGSGEGGVSISS